MRDRSSVPAVERPIERLETRLDPERIKVRHLQGFGGYLSWGQVSEVLRGGGLDERQRSALERARWGRVGMLLSNLMTLVAAMPFFLVRLPGAGVGAAVKALPVVALGLVAAAAAPVAAIPGLAAPVSAFVPSAILAPIAAALFSGMKT